MKIKLPVSILLFGLLATTSCKKFLDTKPEDFISPVNYYNTLADLNAAVAGVYDRLGDTRVYGECMFTNLVFSDEFFCRAATTGINANDFDASQLIINRNFEALFAGVERANQLLENLDKANASQADKDEIRGQALFMRSYYLYILADMYGDIPLKITSTTSPTEAPLPRTPVKEVFEQVVKDMKTAATLVKPITSYNFSGRASKTAVYGVLSRVCLKMAGFPVNDASKLEQARAYADSVIQSGVHALNPSYSQIFINHSQDKYDIKESIWEVEFWGNNTTQFTDAGKVGAVNGIVCTDQEVGVSTDNIRTTRKLYNAYGAGDLRRDWSIAPYRFVTSGTTTTKTNWTASQIYDRNCGKWRREYELLTPKSRTSGPGNFPLLRYSDVLLMYAEAENELNGASAAAYEAINQVRRRAYGLPVNTPSVIADIPAGFGKDEFRKAVQDERFRELAFEGIRKHDLIRWGIYVSTMSDLVTDITTNAPAAYTYAATAARNTTARNVLFPIPNSELTVNPNIVQNQGW